MVLKYCILLIHGYAVSIPVSCWITWAQVMMMSSFTSTPVPQAPLPVCTLTTLCTAPNFSNAAMYDHIQYSMYDKYTHRICIIKYTYVATLHIHN